MNPDKLLVSTLAATGIDVEFFCPACHASAVAPSLALVRRYHGAVTLAELEHKARCPKCLHPQVIAQPTLNLASANMTDANDQENLDMHAHLKVAPKRKDYLQHKSKFG